MPLVLVQVGGLVGIAAGLLILGARPLADLGGAAEGILSQLPVTFPAAVSVGLATAMDLAAGAVLVRLVRWTPYASFAEAALGGLVGAVMKDTMLLLALGSVGHFQPLVIALLDMALIGGGLLLRPFVRLGGSPARPHSWIALVLPVVLWAIPVVVTLSAPVVPFVEGLPNHVAPIEHLRSYASYASLAVSPSPLYGPSALSLGYIAGVGSIAALTGLPAALAVAAFALPLAVLLGTASYHLARSLGEPSAGYWTLLIVPLTFAFVRLPDASAVVLALVAASPGLTLIVERGAFDRPEAPAGRSRPVLVAASLGATVLIHPLVGAITLVTLVLLGLARPAADRRAVLWGIVGGVIVGAPQLVLMSGAALPAWTGLPAWPLGLVAAAALGGPGHRRGELSEPLPPARSFGTVRLLLAAIAGLALIGVGSAYVIERQPQLPADVGSWLAPVVLAHSVLAVGLLTAIVFVRERRAWIVFGAALTAGLLAIAIGMLAPAETALGQALRGELPEVAAYWMPWMAAIAGGVGLGALWSLEAWPAALRGAICAVFVVAAALPIRWTVPGPAGPTESSPDVSREHPYAESAAIALDRADRGYWVGYPDSRMVVGAPGRALLEAIRSEQSGGRMRAATELLHVAASVDPWEATPLGALTGVIETALVPELPTDLPSEQGRVHATDELAAFAGPERPYVVIEGYPSSSSFDQLVRARGYAVVSEGPGWRLLRLSGQAPD